jgi:glycerol-3-phosphate dehydrogenase (NAD(P)+)
MTRLGLAMGVPMTFAGLAGMGDLILTTTGALSRNRSLGVALAEGQAWRSTAAHRTVAEGARPARPFSSESGMGSSSNHPGGVHPVRRQGAKQAVAELMERALKSEQWR